MVSNSHIYTALAAQKIGVSKPTLLRWFAQGKIKEVPRDVRGWRIFSDHDIKRISDYANKIQQPK